MVWCTLRIQDDGSGEPRGFVETALNVDGYVSDWTSVDAAGTQFNTLALAKLPEAAPEEILAQGEFRVNIPSAEVWKLVLPAKVATPSVIATVTETSFVKREDGIPDVVQQFAKLFAREIVASGSLDRSKAMPQRSQNSEASPLVERSIESMGPYQEKSQLFYYNA